MTYVSLNARESAIRNPKPPVSASILQGIICQWHVGIGTHIMISNLILKDFCLVKETDLWLF